MVVENTSHTLSNTVVRKTNLQRVGLRESSFIFDTACFGAMKNDQKQHGNTQKENVRIEILLLFTLQVGR